MVYMFACSIGCFINDDWEIIERVIDFKPLEDKEHEGLHGGKAFADGACKIGGLDKISSIFDSGHGSCSPRLHCISISTDNASVNDVIVATVARILLAKYGIPPSPNLATLGEADSPDKIDYYTLNKEQPLHPDINADPDQIELDKEEFQDEMDDEAAPEENIILEEEEKLKAMESPLSKVCCFGCEDIRFWPTNVYVSYATLPTRLFQHPSDGRSFGNAQSQNTSKRTRSTRTGVRLWLWSGMSVPVGTTHMQ
jgi:hypothetical protein